MKLHLQSLIEALSAWFPDALVVVGIIKNFQVAITRAF